jgi:capsular exopolysaccharide synthesis family protein
MGFFYQAIKKATGQVEEAAEREAPAESPLVEAPPQRRETAATVAPSLEAPTPLAPARPAPVPAQEHGLRVHQRFEVRHPLENLVAFLTPPVLDTNVVAMEQCRVLRTRLRDAMRAKNLRTVMFTSAMPGEGKTLLSVNLAYALSQIENVRVLLVDCDLRRPSVSNFLKMNVTHGLGTYLTKGDRFDQVCWELTPSLHVVPTQECSEDAAELLHGTRMQEFLALVRGAYSFILFDGPPLFPIVDAQVLSSLVDSVVLVTRADSTPFDLANQASEIVKGKLIGTILNCADRLPHSGYYGTYGYGAYGKYYNTKKSAKK